MKTKNKIHNLDIFTEYFNPVFCNVKNFEVREKRDRNFKVGDTLILHEINKITKEKTGRTVTKQIVYTLDDEQFCKTGYIILGF